MKCSRAPAARAARERLVAPAELRREERALVDAGASSAAVQALREQRVGAEAAARLAELDRKRAEWNRRLGDYATAVRSIDADPALSEDQKAAARRRLRQERFEGHEIARIDVLERAGLLPDAAAPVAADSTDPGPAAADSAAAAPATPAGVQAASE